ncbi:MAG: hypothetical protein GYB24_04605 [Rhodobacteraceae bacterium]|nr:hypothetical protein [Paracoccaceae bacterium]
MLAAIVCLPDTGAILPSLSIPLFIVTGRFDPWPKRPERRAPSSGTVPRMIANSMAGLSHLQNPVLNGITSPAGNSANERLNKMGASGLHFEAYTFEPGARNRPLQRDNRKKSE